MTQMGVLISICICIYIYIYICMYICICDFEYKILHLHDKFYFVKYVVFLGNIFLNLLTGN